MILNMYWQVVKMWKFVVVGLILNTISASHIEVPKQSTKPTDGCTNPMNTMSTSTSEVVTSTIKEATSTTEIPTITESMTSTSELITTLTDNINTTEIPTTTTEVISTTKTEMPTSTSEVMTTTTTAIPTSKTEVITTTTTAEAPKTTTLSTTIKTEKTTTTTDMTTTKKIETTTEALKCPFYATAVVQKAMFSFSTKLLYEIEQGSTIVSGAPFMYILGLLKLRASPKSTLNKQLTELFGTADNNVIKCGLQQINTNVGQFPRDVAVTFANNIIADVSRLFSNITIHDMKYVVGSERYRPNYTDLGEASNLNFDDQETATKIINEKVKNQTLNKITEVLDSPQLVNKTSQLLYVSGLSYLSPFLYKPKEMVLRNFSVTPCQSEIILYYNFCDSFKYINTPSFEMVEIKKSGEQDLILIKPKKKDGHMELLKHPDAILLAKATMTRHVINIYFPAINASTTNNLLELLKKMNSLSSLYTATTSQYKDLFVKEQPANVTLAVQKINFVSEHRGERESSKICEQTHQKIITMNFNSSFVWMLFMENTPLFMGVYADADYAQF